MIETEEIEISQSHDNNFKSEIAVDCSPAFGPQRNTNTVYISSYPTNERKNDNATKTNNVKELSHVKTIPFNRKSPQSNHQNYNLGTQEINSNVQYTNTNTEQVKTKQTNPSHSSGSNFKNTKFIDLPLEERHKRINCLRKILTHVSVFLLVLFCIVIITIDPKTVPRIHSYGIIFFLFLICSAKQNCMHLLVHSLSLLLLL